MSPKNGTSKRSPTFSVRLFRDAPVVLHVDARVEHVQWLNRFVLAGDVVPADLEPPQRHRRGRPVRIGQIVVGVRVEVGERVVDVDALRPGKKTFSDSYRSALPPNVSECFVRELVKLFCSWNVS